MNIDWVIRLTEGVVELVLLHEILCRHDIFGHDIARLTDADHTGNLADISIFKTLEILFIKHKLAHNALLADKLGMRQMLNVRTVNLLKKFGIVERNGRGSARHAERLPIPSVLGNEVTRGNSFVEKVTQRPRTLAAHRHIKILRVAVIAARAVHTGARCLRQQKLTHFGNIHAVHEIAERNGLTFARFRIALRVLRTRNRHRYSR